METNKILNADVLDIIFDGKNKDYGAYQLRKNYNKRLSKALMTMSGLLLLFFVGSVMANKLGEREKGSLKVDDPTTLTNINNPKPPAPPPPPPPPPLPPPPPQVKITAFTPPKIVEDKLVDNPPPPTETLEISKIGAITQSGGDDRGIVAPPVETKGTGTVVVPKSDNKVGGEGSEFVPVEIVAKFPGGTDGWKRYLERNLQYPEAAQQNGNQAIVRVQLVVDKDGNVSEVKALNNPGDGLAEEAERVIKKGPKWIPAEQNGQHVTYRFVQTITFQLEQ